MSAFDRMRAMRTVVAAALLFDNQCIQSLALGGFEFDNEYLESLLSG